MTVNRDKGRGEKIMQEQYVDDKKIVRREGFLYLKVRMAQYKTGTRIGLVGSTPLSSVIPPRLNTFMATNYFYKTVKFCITGLVAQWTTRRSTEPKIAGSNPAEQVKNGKEGHVYVTRVRQGSLGAECLIVGDRILQVNDTTINDKEVAKKAIVKGLLLGSVTFIVERPDSPIARTFASEVMAVRTPPTAYKS
uniref:PDZ domain-containing protein n=1 Tax=Setaria digitata TaxID=48799 RepID=A0A915PQ11_9BILA